MQPFLVKLRSLIPPSLHLWTLGFYRADPEYGGAETTSFTSLLFVTICDWHGINELLTLEWAYGRLDMSLRMRRYALTLSPPARCGLNTIRGLYRDPLLLLLGAHVPSNALNLTVIRIQSYPSDPSHQ